MLTPQSIIPFVSDPPLRHKYYKDSCDMYEDIMVHSDGHFPEKLLGTARPNEDDIYKKYRKDVWEPITKTYWGKIINTLSKIRRAEGFSIKFNEDTRAQKQFKEYVIESYPGFDSVENWFFTFFINIKCKDANAVLAVIPFEKESPNDDAEMWRPFVFIFNSPKVLMFKDKYCILEDKECSSYVVENLRKKGKIIHAIDTDVYHKYEQTGEDEKGNPVFTLAREIKHNFGYMPAFKSGGKINEYENSETLYDSHISDCLPFFNEGTRRYSDHQVNMVLHLHPNEWEIADTICPTCKGKGNMTGMEGGQSFNIPCGKCNGGGNISIKSPFGKKIIRPATQTGVNMSEQIPTPPMGYANRDIASISFLKEEYKDDIRNGLAAINLENLMNEPLVNSGVAKNYDRQEQEAFIYDFFRDCVHNNMIPIYYFCAKWMFGNVASEQEIMKMVPNINIPQDYSIINSGALANEAKIAIESNFSSLITDSLQLEYARKQMGEDNAQVVFMENMLLLDPLPNKTEEEKMTAFSVKAITQEAYVISDNLYSFLTRASQEDKKFFEKTYTEKNVIIKNYAQEIITANKVTIVPMVTNG